MKDFDAIKEMWQQQQPAEENAGTPDAVVKKTASTKTILLRQQLRGSVIMILTGIYITWIAFFSSIHFKLAITYIAIFLMLTVILIQAAVGFYTYKKLKVIDDMLPPAAHLKQWEEYYLLRKKQVRLNLPLYYILLNAAFGMYFIEILGGRSFFWSAVVIAIYIAWMLFAYFVLGKRSLAKEEKRLKVIMDNLKKLTAQLNTSSL